MQDAQVTKSLPSITTLSLLVGTTVVVCWFFFQNQIFQKFLQEYHQSVKQFGSRSGRVQCAWKGYQQATLVGRVKTTNTNFQEKCHSLPCQISSGAGYHFLRALSSWHQTTGVDNHRLSDCGNYPSWWSDLGGLYHLNLLLRLALRSDRWGLRSDYCRLLSTHWSDALTWHPYWSLATRAKRLSRRTVQHRWLTET